MADSSPLIRPIPRRPFSLGPASTSAESSRVATPTREKYDPSQADQESSESKATSQTRSFLNLTSSTLLGIYSPSGYESVRGEPSTPWGTGTHTPLRMPNIDENRPIMLPQSDAFLRRNPNNRSSQNHLVFRNTLLQIIERTILLFLSGVGYGLVISHLHDTQRLAPVPVESIDRSSLRYLMLWGATGVCLGGLLPWVDIFWNKNARSGQEFSASTAMPETPRPPRGSHDEDERLTTRSRNGLITGWNPVIRGIGAFVGIAFAIVRNLFRGWAIPMLLTRFQRRLPWQSTLQVSLALTLINPVLWYLVDRSKPGFILSAFVGIAGAAVVLGVNPEMVPSPSASPRAGTSANSFEAMMHHELISSESIGVWTWVSSVLFCSSVCFGNIGRRLATGQPGLISSLG